MVTCMMKYGYMHTPKIMFIMCVCYQYICASCENTDVFHVCVCYQNIYAYDMCVFLIYILIYVSYVCVINIYVYHVKIYIHFMCACVIITFFTGVSSSAGALLPYPRRSDCQNVCVCV